jgi:5-methylcytosine-specific restriction endonuclease McrA
MNAIRLKSPRLRLDSTNYRELYRQVLERDGWRCQVCGSMQNLQVHHLKFRSRSGGDIEQNLITLCAECHEKVHRKVKTLGSTQDEGPVT